MYTRILHHEIETSANEGSNKDKLAIRALAAKIKSRLVCRHMVRGSIPASFRWHLGIEGARCVPCQCPKADCTTFMGPQDKPVQEKLHIVNAGAYEISSQMDQPLSGAKERPLNVVR